MIRTASAFAIILFCLGLLAVLTKRNLFKTIIGLTLMEGGVLLLMVAAGHLPQGIPPIHEAVGSSATTGLITPMVNPLPQAFALTAIVIGACDIALGLALIVKLHRYYGTVDIDEIRGLKG